MFPPGVVVAIDVVEDRGAGVGDVFEASVLNQLVLDGSDHRLGPGVVVGVRPPRHALSRRYVGELLAEGPAPVLAAAIAVEDELRSESNLVSDT